MIVHICSHPSVAPIVFRVKFNCLRLAFLSFQNPTQHIFSLTAYRYFFSLSNTCCLFSQHAVPISVSLTHFHLYLQLCQLPALCFLSNPLWFHWVFLTHLLGLLLDVLLCTQYLSNSMASNLGSVIASARLGFLPQSP